MQAWSFCRTKGFSGPWTVVLAVMSLASMLFGNLAALAQISVRRLLAYSAIAHAGYILLALAYFRFDPAARQQSASAYRVAPTRCCTTSSPMA